MATIFPKVNTILGFDNTLVLDHREALLYPFDVGSDWRNIKLGLFVSLAGATGDNSSYNNENVAGSITIATTRGYLGIKNNNIIYPTVSGSNFLGVTARIGPAAITYATSSLNTMGFSENGNGDTRFRICSDSIVGGSIPGQVGVTVGTAVAGTQPSAYAFFYGLDIIYNQSSMAVSGAMINSTAPFTDTSIGNLRIQMSSPTATTAYSTGFFSSNLSSTGTQLSRPDAVFIYFPFFTNKVRIHNLCVERYA